MGVEFGKSRPRLLHLGKTPVEDGLFQLEVRDAVTEKPPIDATSRNKVTVVAGAMQLLAADETRRTRADHGHTFPVRKGGGSG